MMKISLILEAVNRATGPIREVVAALERMGRSGALSARRVASSMMYMRDQVIDATHHFRRLAGPEGIGRAGRSIDYLKRQVSGLTGGLTLMKYAAGAAIVGLGEEFVRGVFKAGGETEQMLVTLKRFEGGARQAKQAMSWLQNFGMGAGAAFSMPDIMRSYQMAKNFGMNPQGGAMTAFADLAAGERVPLKQVLIAVKDAMEGTSTRPIANLGIKMKQGKGDAPNSYLYSDLVGKWHTEHFEKTPEATLAALIKIINSKYMGLAGEQAGTVLGGFQQMKKLLYLFEGKVASSGLFDWALKRMNQFFAWIRKAAQSGYLDRLAKMISNFLTSSGDKLIAFLQKTDWGQVGADIHGLGVALLALGGALEVLSQLGGGGLSGLLNLWIAFKVIGITRALMGLWPVLRAGASMLRILAPLFVWLADGILALFTAMNPIAWIIASIVALGIAGVLLWRNWSTVSKALARIWRSLPLPLQVGLAAVSPLIGNFVQLALMIRRAWAPLTAFFTRLWNGIANSFSTGIPKVWNAVPTWMRSLLGGAAGAAFGPTGAAIGAALGGADGRSPTHPKAPAPKHDIGGHVVIELRGDHRDARVTKLRATNPKVGLSVKRGPVMAGG